MAYMELFRQLNFLTNFSCNKACPYCYMTEETKKKQIELSIPELKSVISKYLLRIKPTAISLVGGEPGLLSAEVVDTILSEFTLYATYHRYDKSSNVMVYTNGLFIDNHLERVLHKYKSFHIACSYHIAPEPTISWHNKYEVYKNNIIYTFVIQKENTKGIKEFLDKFGNTELIINPTIATNADFAVQDLKAIYKLLRNYSSISPMFMKGLYFMSNATSTELQLMKELCQHIQINPQLNLMQHDIKYCCLVDNIHALPVDNAFTSDELSQKLIVNNTAMCDDCFVIIHHMPILFSALSEIMHGDLSLLNPNILHKYSEYKTLFDKYDKEVTL